jgi:hypothetical protein
VVGELPEGVGERGPEGHGGEGVVLGRVGGGGADGVEGGEAGGLERGGDEVHEAVEGYAGHDVDEETAGG